MVVEVFVVYFDDENVVIVCEGFCEVGCEWMKVV